MGKWRKKGFALLKILFSALLLYLVFTRIPFSQVWAVLKNADLVFIGLALLFFIASKVLSAYRLNLYFHQIGVPLPQGSNLRLYLLGMFYNLFLPGGIGGDAYKGYLVHKTFGTGGKRLAAVLLLDRLSGMLLLFVYSGILLLWISAPWLDGYYFIIWLLGGAGFTTYWLGYRKGFDYLMPIFWPSLGYSSFVQLAQLIAAYFILQALGVTDSLLPYLFVFLISSIVAVLPITIGGVGSRELVFYYGALLLQLEESTSIGISMAFFLITALVSSLGLFYHFRKPRLLLVEGPAD